MNEPEYVALVGITWSRPECALGTDGRTYHVRPDAAEDYVGDIVEGEECAEGCARVRTPF